jgi:hypothetical protein
VRTGTLKLAFNLLALVLAAGLALGLCRPGLPPDALWRQLAYGRLIVSQGGFPASDPFNFSLPAAAGFDKDGWLFSVAAYGLHQIAGPPAALGLRSILLLGAFFFMLAAGFRRGARPFSTALFSLAALLAILPYAEFGPALAGLFFFAAAAYLMEGEFWPAFFARWIWLPALMVPALNFSGSALLILPLALAWALGEKNSDSPLRPALPGLALAGTLGILGACAFIHPALWRTLAFALPGPLATPFESGAFEAARPALALLSAALLLLLSGAALPQGPPHAARDLLVFAGLALPALLWRGLLPYACLLAAPMAAARAGQVMDALPSAGRGLGWTLKAAAFAAALFMLPRLFQAGPGKAAPQPAESVDFFKDELLSGNVFNENDWAGKLIWELTPQARVFSDGRRGAAFDYLRIMQASEGWGKLLERYGADFAWLKINSPLAKAMARSAFWQPVDFDDASVLYARVGPPNAKLIKTYAPRGLRPGDMDEPFDASRLPQVEADLEGRRLKRPRSGVLHYYEARLNLEMEREGLARQWLERGIQTDPSFAPNYKLLGELRLKAGDKKGAQPFFERAMSLGGL